jgi:hypothetical protein
MTFTLKDLTTETPQVQSTLLSLLGAITLEHSREKVPDPKLLVIIIITRRRRRHLLGLELHVPRTVVYPMEIADLMSLVKSGQQHTLLVEHEQVGAEIARLSAGWAKNPYSYEETLQLESNVARWVPIAQSAALSSHKYILEDGPELPKVPGPNAEEGGKILEGMYVNRSTSLEELKIIEGREGGQVSAAVVRSGPAGIVSKDPRILPT